MALAKASASASALQKSSAFSGSAARLQPVPMGSRSTRSEKASQLSGLLSSGAAASGGEPNSTMRGPSRPRCRQAEAAPGPPLHQKVTGRVAGPVGGAAPDPVYDRNDDA